MKFTILKIPVKDIKNFITSVTYKTLKEIPISKQRAKSYANNPKANSDDFILYMGFKNGVLIGYRTLLIDTFFTENTEEKFAWLSGSWVHKKHRRKGVSTALFNEIYKDWNGKLMYTNYAVASKKLYDKTMHFSVLNSLEGKRFYIRSCFADILPLKSVVFKKTKCIWEVFDTVFNFFIDRNRKHSNKKSASYSVTKSTKLYDNQWEFIAQFKKRELFKRNQKIYDWIHTYPWVLSDKESKINAKKYYFSSYAKNFLSNFYTFYNKKNNEVLACVLITIKDDTLKMPYAFIDKNAIIFVANFIIEICQNQKIKHLTIYHQEIEKVLDKKLSFLTKKKFIQHFFVSKSLLIKHPEIVKKTIQSGDGDVVFT